MTFYQTYSDKIDSRHTTLGILCQFFHNVHLLFFSRSGVIEKLEALELENPEKMEVEESGRSGARQGRSEHRRFHREVTPPCVRLRTR